MIGWYTFGKPTVTVTDLELVKAVLIKDFDHFVDRRRIPVNEATKANRISSQILTALEGEKWKRMRSTLSPVFTSGKLKGMAQLLNKVISNTLN